MDGRAAAQPQSRSTVEASAYAGRELRLALAVAAIGVLAAYVVIHLPFLVRPHGIVGRDYSYFMPQLLAGYYWFEVNGALAVPWFTPAFCAGVPYFPNMQGIYYSVPQLLTFVAGPVRALELTFLGFAAAGFAGFHLLLRRAFAIAPWCALAGATIFLFNGFYTARLFVGHLAFHAFMLAPFLGVFALDNGSGAARRGWLDARLLAGGLVIAYMIHSGMVHALPPTLLAIVAVLLIHGNLFGFAARPFVRLAVMVAFGTLVSAAKIVAGAAFLAQFPRDMLPLPGFSHLWQVLAITVQSVFFAPPFWMGTAWLVNDEWWPGERIYLSYHEYDYGVTYVALLLVAAWFAARLWRRSRGASRSRSMSRTLSTVGVATILALPILLNWYEPTWNGFLKSLPFLGNSSTMIRWFCIFVLLGALGASLAMASLAKASRVRNLLALVVLGTTIFSSTLLDRSYYTVRADYDPAKIEAAYDSVATGGQVPSISRIEWPYISNSERLTRRDRNEHLVAGGSSAECYEPMFGHRLEAHPRGPLFEGPALSARAGVLNVKNPACMVYPDSNECRPGDHFAVGQIDDARRFLDYRPFEFRLPWWQRAANWTSLATIGFVLLVLGYDYSRRFMRSRAASMLCALGSQLARKLRSESSTFPKA